jgi:hypothetical protein
MRPITNNFIRGSMRMYRSIACNLLIASVLFVASGCLLSTSNSVRESGKPVSASTLRQIELGQTREDWLIATLGEPTSRAQVRGPDDVQILGYNHEVLKKSRGKIFLLFSGSSQQVDRDTTYFEITDGVVTRYWTEA